MKKSNALIAVMLSLFTPNAFGKGKGLPPGSIYELMHPQIVHAAFYDPFAVRNMYPSHIFRAYIRKHSEGGATLFTDKVNFAIPDFIEWQSSFPLPDLLDTKDKKAHPDQIHLCCLVDYLRWNQTDFEFSFQDFDSDYTCRIGIEKSSKPNCKKNTTSKD
jgi:hypothetical protein